VALFAALVAACAGRRSSPARSAPEPEASSRRTAGSAPEPAVAATAEPGDAAPTDTHGGAETVDDLAALRFVGPEKSLAEICGTHCRVRQTLPRVAPFMKLLLADGEDLPPMQNRAVVTTHLVFQANDGWYGSVVMRVGKGTEDIELVNPLHSGMPPFGHMRRPVTYTGRLGRVRAIEDRATKQALVALELTRSSGLEEHVLIVCGADQDEHPACGELRTQGAISHYAVERRMIDVHWASGEHERFRLSF
jgi:hypothetical protein